jgi:predicted transcriptional regulator
METIEISKMVTIHIDESFHTAMKSLARQRKVLISNVYEQAVELYLDHQNNPQKTAKKTNVSAVPRR